MSTFQPKANELVANIVVGDTDRTAANPNISFGGDQYNNPGTGIRGDLVSMSHSVSGTDVHVINANGVFLSNSIAVCFLNAGAPTNGTTGATITEKGSLLIDTTNAKLYINTGTKSSPTWTIVGSQS